MRKFLSSFLYALASILWFAGTFALVVVSFVIGDSAWHPYGGLVAGGMAIALSVAVLQAMLEAG